MKTTIGKILEKEFTGKTIKVYRYIFLLKKGAEPQYRYFISKDNIPKDERFSFDKETIVDITAVDSFSDKYEGDAVSFIVLDKENGITSMLSLTILDEIEIN